MIISIRVIALVHILYGWFNDKLVRESIVFVYTLDYRKRLYL